MLRINLASIQIVIGSRGDEARLKGHDFRNPRITYWSWKSSKLETSTPPILHMPFRPVKYVAEVDAARLCMNRREIIQAINSAPVGGRRCVTPWDRQNRLYDLHAEL
jgi:hypothetical protein